jgi:hypothetical protein
VTRILPAIPVAAVAAARVPDTHPYRLTQRGSRMAVL